MDLKVIPAKKGQTARILITGATHRQLDILFSDTRWRNGGHKQALLMLEGVDHWRNAKGNAVTTRIGGANCRALEIPARWHPDAIIPDVSEES